MNLPRAALIALTATLASCDGGEPAAPPAPDAAAGPTAEDAKAFAAKANDELRTAWVASAKASWTYVTDITDEHEAAVSEAEAASMATLNRLIAESRPYAAAEGLDPDTARQLDLLRKSAALPPPKDEAAQKELAEVTTKLQGMYGKGEYCKDGECRDLGDLEKVLSTSRDPRELLDAWAGWRTVSPPMKPMYSRFVELSNQGARDIGFKDTGHMWRSMYDMPPDAMVTEVDRLWSDVEPLYKKLHCHVRAKLREQYGADVVPETGPIPAHLLGNMWSQSWENIYPLVEPFPGQPSIDVTKALNDKGYDELKMVKLAEGFFTSIGLDPLPETFWKRSMFVKPEGKEVVCHASAWDVTMNNDLRIKMCIKVDHEDLVTLHHELGHDYYYHYYYTLPALYQNGAHDGFHEGIGDAVALSITPQHLKEVGLLDEVADNNQAMLNRQMQDALAKIAFLPFGRMIDQWRWDVFSGAITPEQYNARWWELREKYQGIASPIPRTEANFDPGAKYHIPANTPYMRYFLAHILQFQFHQAMCEASGYEGPLHTCSVYGSKEAGAKLQAMLEKGSSQPWQDTLVELTGTREMDATALRTYFSPLETYLDKQNEGRTCGW